VAVFAGIFGFSWLEIYETHPFVSPPTALDPKDPLLFPFSIENKGHFLTLHKLLFNCDLTDKEPIEGLGVPAGLEFSMHGGYKDAFDLTAGIIRADDCGMRLSNSHMQCELDTSAGRRRLGVPERFFLGNIDMTIKVSYSVNFIVFEKRFSADFPFYIQANSQGQAQWIPGHRLWK